MLRYLVSCLALALALASTPSTAQVRSQTSGGVATETATKSFVANAIAGVSTTINTSIALKADAARTIIGGGLATGGGNLSADRTITVPKASGAEASTGTDDTKAVTPLALATPLATKGGLAAANTWTGTNTYGPLGLKISGAVGTDRLVQFQTAGVNRFLFGATSGAEGGSNAGSNLSLSTVQDGGAYGQEVYNVNRATGWTTHSTTSRWIGANVADSRSPILSGTPANGTWIAGSQTIPFHGGPDFGNTVPVYAQTFLRCTSVSDAMRYESCLNLDYYNNTGAAGPWPGATQAVALGKFVQINGGKQYKATTAGTTGATQPTWPATGTVTDGSVVWTYQDDGHSNAKSGFSLSSVSKAGGGNHWLINPNCIIDNGYRNQLYCIELDVGNYSGADWYVGAPFPGVQALWIGGVTTNTGAAAINIGSQLSTAGKPAWYFAFWCGNALAAGQGCFEDWSNSVAGFHTSSFAVKTHDIWLQASSVNGIYLNGTYSGAQIAGNSWSVTPAGKLISSAGMELSVSTQKGAFTTATNNNPFAYWYNSGGTANGRKFAWVGNGASTYFQLYNDADAFVANFVEFRGTNGQAYFGGTINAPSVVSTGAITTTGSMVAGTGVYANDMVAITRDYAQMRLLTASGRGWRLVSGANGTAFDQLAFQGTADGFATTFYNPLVLNGDLTISLNTFTIGSLPTCNGTTAGRIARITNGLSAPAYAQTVSATGAAHKLVMCDATNWVYN